MTYLGTVFRKPTAQNSMDTKCRVLEHFQKHYKKIFVIFSTAIAVYFVHKFVMKKMFGKRTAGKREPLKDFPSIDDIQKFIEELPFDAVKMDKTVTLKDLLGELSEFSEDEEWKELIASVHSLYQESPRINKGDNMVQRI
ncbi:unnamed protein product [Acanthoscelides obtectus]|uniref:Uncharacterized protein n=1 Tax=Acanthoscelides obtectus TaxID=200917 RepID=A0A9P0PPY0_ACAOB|nr:unnamed protein product [Acanthoscelides obtectus]CAK1658895.1 hypothetical protein AOBTE_LOCUS21187 [Acanthoscelides obtectus]